MTGIFQAGKHRLPFGTHTYVMGILNVTPDSFSDGGKWLEPEKAVAHALEMEEQGAEILDVGAQSTRPGFEPVAWEVEWGWPLCWKPCGAGCGFPCRWIPFIPRWP